MATAAAMATPSVRFSSAVVKVAMPSGKLWIVMASAVITPMRIRRVFFGLRSISSTVRASCGFSNDGTRRSMMPMSRMPAKKAATAIPCAVRADHEAASAVSA